MRFRSLHCWRKGHDWDFDAAKSEGGYIVWLMTCKRCNARWWR